MVEILINERRRRPHVDRPFERRLTGADDSRVIGYLEEMGTKKVKSQLERGGFSGRSAMAQRWLKKKRQSIGLKFLRMAGLF